MDNDNVLSDVVGVLPVYFVTVIKQNTILVLYII